MAPVNGLELLEKCKELPRNNNIPTILMSGYIASLDSDEITEKYPNATLLEKPINLKGLSKMIHELGHRPR